MNCELPDVQPGFRKGRGTRDQIANIRWAMEKAREFQKNIYFCFIDYTKAFDCVDHNKLLKILKEMGIPDHLTCLLRNLYAGQEGAVRTGHGTTDWFQIGKGVCQGCILSLCLLNLYAVYIMRNAGLEKQKLESRLPGEISVISDATKVVLKILQARLQQYVNCELPDVQPGFRKGRGTRDQIANIRWIMEKAREFQKNIYFCFIDYAKAFDCVDHNKLWKILKEM